MKMGDLFELLSGSTGGRWLTFSDAFGDFDEPLFGMCGVLDHRIGSYCLQ